jgi:DNA-binding response OmpR family regulator
MDDEDFIRDIVGAFLAMEGYEVLEAKNGQEALEICVDAQRDGKPVGGAVFDLVIPGGPGGRDAIVDFRRIFPDMPIFASSGASADPIMEQPTEHGFTGSICKPFKMNELMALLQAHLK